MSESEKERSGSADNADAGLRYHLNVLYGLRPVPDEFMQLASELEQRLRTETQ